METHTGLRRALYGDTLGCGGLYMETPWVEEGSIWRHPGLRRALYGETHWVEECSIWRHPGLRIVLYGDTHWVEEGSLWRHTLG